MVENNFEQNSGGVPVGLTQPSGGGNGTDLHNEYGQIRDEKAAEDVAYVEKGQGRDAALRREQALEKQLETGLTAEEAINLAKVEILVNAFPNVFEEKFGEDGNPEYVADPSSGTYNYQITGKYVGEERTDRYAENFNLIWEIGDKYRGPQEETLPFGLLFQSFAKNGPLITFSKDGVRLSSKRGESFTTSQRQLIPFSSFTEEHIKTLSKILKPLNENKEIGKEVSRKIESSKSVRTWGGIVEETLEESGE
jgi:hypothetical protein